MDKSIVVGRVSGVFGTRGWLKVLSYTRPLENILAHNPWSLVGDGRTVDFELVESRRHHGGFIAALAGISDRDEAAKWVRSDIVVSRAQLPAASPEEFYWVDLLGLAVINTAGQPLGVVAGVLETAAHDVLRVKGDCERLIPFVRGVYVHAIDLQRGQMEVDWHIDD